MYFPLLRGKQNELLAVRELDLKLADHGGVIPIIEPVKDTNRSIGDLHRCFTKLEDSGAKSIFIVNPQCGDFARNRRALRKIFDEIIDKYESVCFGLWIDGGTDFHEVQTFIDSVRERDFYLLHSSAYAEPDELKALDNLSNFQGHIVLSKGMGRKYLSQIENEKVILNDHFEKQDTNALYRNSQNKFFSDQYLTFEEDGYLGFGDFVTIGYEYVDGGFTPYTVAIHLTYKHKINDEVWIRHFLSTTATVNPNAQEMILEALDDFASFIDDHPEILEFSEGCRELFRIYQTGEGTSLGNLKKLSIKHHLELMMELV